jgi:NADPH:quinone reductase-like Zn-dependent oxidoreductase
VEAVGADVADLKPGDAVTFVGGAFAEYTLVRRLPRPDDALGHNRPNRPTDAFY